MFNLSVISWIDFPSSKWIGFLITILKFKIYINEPVFFSKETSIKTITDELNKILEKMVIKKPDQWIWSHNRWK